MEGNNNNNGIIGNEMNMPKVLDFLQTEWLKFEVDKAHWISEKAELTNRILKLESEKRINEQLKYDLVKRVKMLEYALQLERNKNNKSSNNNSNNNIIEDNNIPNKRDAPKKSKDNTTRIIIRKYLKEFGYDDIIVPKSLPNNEYDELNNNNINNNSNNVNENSVNINENTIQTVLDLKNNLNNNLNMNNNNENKQSISPPQSTIHQHQHQQQQQQQDNSNKEATSLDFITASGTNVNDLTQSLDSLSSSLSNYDSESLLDSLDQLNSAANSDVSSGSDRSINNSTDLLDKQQQQQPSQQTTTTTTTSSSTPSTEEYTFEESIFNTLTNIKGKGNRIKVKGLANINNMKDLQDFEKQNNINSSSNNSKNNSSNNNGDTFIFPSPDQNNEEKTSTLSSSSSSSSTNNGSNGGSTRSKKSMMLGSIKKNKSLSSSGGNTGSSSLSELKGALGASDLNDITLDDSSKNSLSDSAAPRNWKLKHTLRSHLDGVRSIQFHPSEPLMVSSSEDHSIKVWNLNHLAPTKKSPSPEIEPIYTIRGHHGPVYTTEWNKQQGEDSDYQTFFSAGFDMIIKEWSLPPSDIDPYHQHGCVVNYLKREFVGHKDGIWDLVSIPHMNQLLSASADGTIALWDTNVNSAAQQLYSLSHPLGKDRIPTSLSLPPTEGNRKLLAAYKDGSILMFDLETQQIIHQLKQQQSTYENIIRGGDVQINKIVSHPLLPLAMTGTEDNKIEFFDLSSNTIVHSMVAHTSSISSITIDPSGLYLASCSHDSSIRFWDINSKTCIQDLPSHRPKYDEAIHTIKYHPNKGYFASGGADSVIRIHQ